MSTSQHDVLVNAQSHLVRDTASGGFLGAFGTNFWRSFVYPFCTPSGRSVVENAPFDHPFHNCFFVGQNPVKVGNREGNFWALPVKRSYDDHIMAIYNPTWERSITLAAGESWTVSLRAVAYDGALTGERADAWKDA